MNAEFLAATAGVLLSLACSYVPGLKQKFDELQPDHKRLAMLGLMLAVAVGVYFNAAGFAWDPGAFNGALSALFAAAIANQATYSLSVGVRPLETAMQSSGLEDLPLGGHLTRQFPDQLAANGYIRSVRKLEEQASLEFAIVGPTKRWWSRWVSVVVWRVA